MTSRLLTHTPSLELPSAHLHSQLGWQLPPGMSSVKEYHHCLLAAGAGAAEGPAADVPSRPWGDQQQGADAAAGTSKAAKRASGKGTAASKEVGGSGAGLGAGPACVAKAWRSIYRFVPCRFVCS